MDNKTLSIVSYITIIGWLISYFSSKDQSPKSSLVIYHQQQSLGLIILGFIYGLFAQILITIIPAVAIILSLTSIIFIVLMIIGIINAMNEIEKPLPFVGKIFIDEFNFIK